MPIRLAIFDLDDTLSDHLHSCTCGIEALREQFPVLTSWPLHELVAQHFALLDEWHRKILSGAETAESARRKRNRAFLEAGGLATADAAVFDVAVTCYERGYTNGRRAVPGAADVLRGLHLRGISIVVLSNHHCVPEQQGKLVECGLTHMVDRLFVSADIGHTKPDKAAFAAVLSRCACDAQCAVMVGDSLTTDIEGALSAGLHAVWLNRLRAPVPGGLRAQVLDSFEPPERSIATILGADRSA
jgi:putative hydrolase of the HAD superfamily